MMVSELVFAEILHVFAVDELQKAIEMRIQQQILAG